MECWSIAGYLPSFGWYPFTAGWREATYESKPWPLDCESKTLTINNKTTLFLHLYPTHLSLISPSVILPSFRSSSDISIGPWVIVAGCSTRDSTPPKDTASWISLTLCKKDNNIMYVVK